MPALTTPSPSLYSIVSVTATSVTYAAGASTVTDVAVDFGAAGGGAWLADPATHAPTLAAFGYGGATADPTPDGGAVVHVFVVAGGGDLPAWLAGRAGERRARVGLALGKAACDAVAASVGGFSRWLVPATGGGAHKGSM